MPCSTDWKIIEGKVEEVCEDLDEDVDAVFCDPPYGLGDAIKGGDLEDLLKDWMKGGSTQKGGSGFMDQEWDQVIPPLHWEKIKEVAKPGAFMATFGGTRTFDLQSVAQRLAGWKMRDEVLALAWAQAEGFPKSHDISKAIDKQKEVDREVIGEKRVSRDWSRDGKTGDMAISREPVEETTVNITAPATDEAEKWDGYGTALAPSHEPIGLWRKPTDKTFAETALEEGSGALNIDGCRTPTEETLMGGAYSGTERDGLPGDDRSESGQGMFKGKQLEEDDFEQPSGRWPANLALCHHPTCTPDGCHPDCHVRRMDEQSGECPTGDVVTAGGCEFFMGGDDREGIVGGYTDAEKGASRYFPRFNYCPKAQKSEQEAGLFGEGRQNDHPTVKPVELCEWIANLLLPPERDNPEENPRILLVPFSGSGSEVIGAMLAGWDRVIGIEMNAEYCELSRERIEWWAEYGEEAIEEHRIEEERRNAGGDPNEGLFEVFD